MILITGGTGFVGRALARQLVAAGHSVRLLIRPSPRTPNLPKGVPVEVAVAGLADERGLRAAMRGVDTVYHLASAEHLGSRANLLDVDANGSDALARAAMDAGVKRFFFISHLGADRMSAFPVLKSKGLAEENIRRSGINYTIFRTSILYGPEDHFTTALARLTQLFPLFVFMPGKGDMILQPLWVEDLVTCLVWALDHPETENQVLELGGSEFFTFKEIFEMVCAAAGVRRWLLPMTPNSLRFLTVWMEYSFPRFPVSTLMLDYLALNRTCQVDSIPRLFNFLPARFSQRLGHLRSVNWFDRLLQNLRERN